MITFCYTSLSTLKDRKCFWAVISEKIVNLYYILGYAR